MTNTWILVADGARARLFSRTDRKLDELEDFIDIEGRLPARALDGSGKPRTHERFGTERHAIEPQTQPRDKAAKRFARQLRDVLERGRVDHRYDDLILCAPPRFMGVLRGTIGKPLRDCVSAEIARDLTLGAPSAILDAIAPPG